ncbi:MAG: hypothetical protein WD076_11920 [Parvularculaceae bacterium]
MTLENIYYIGQTVAVVVIVATLIAILFQGYQTNKIARAEMTLSSWMQSGMTHYSLVDTPEKADFMQRALFGGEPLTNAEKLRFGNLMGLAIGMHEGGYQLLQRGFIEQSAYKRSEGITRLYMQSPRVRKWWRTRRDYGYDPRFRAVIDAIAADYEAAQPQQGSEPGR